LVFVWRVEDQPLAKGEILLLCCVEWLGTGIMSFKLRAALPQ
jgi:hypothetical protein